MNKPSFVQHGKATLITTITTITTIITTKTILT